MTNRTASDHTVEADKGRPWSKLELPIGLGTNTFSRTTDEAGSRDVLDAFIEGGGSLIDTADTYSDGAAENIIGSWMRERRNRNRVVIVGKVGNHIDFVDGLSTESISGGLEASLRRLGTDDIDICRC
ncbi:MAG: aldo/keto reductase [Nakamurella sp.]